MAAQGSLIAIVLKFHIEVVIVTTAAALIAMGPLSCTYCFHNHQLSLNFDNTKIVKPFETGNLRDEREI